jgi:transposase
MLKRLVEQHLTELHKLIRDHWREQAQTGATSYPGLASGLARFHKTESVDERQLRERDERYRQRHELVHALAHEGDRKSLRDIAKMTGLARETVRSILKSATYVGVPQRGPRRSPIDGYHVYIVQRIAAGFVNAEQLFKEIQAQGFTGVYSTVWRLVRCLAQQTGQLATHGAVADQPQPASINLPPIFEIIHWLMDKQPALTIEQTGFLQQWLASTPAIQAGRDAARRFTEILTLRQPERLAAWIAEAAASSNTVIKGFAKGIKADYDAILAALQTPWSSAQLEGQINRLKVIKRLMYGRAKFDLLKIRVMTKI